MQIGQYSESEAFKKRNTQKETHQDTRQGRHFREIEPKGVLMKKLRIALLALFLGSSPLLVLGDSTAHADELTQEKRDAIYELLSMTDAVNVGRVFGEAYVQHLAVTLQEINPAVDPKVIYILEEEVSSVIDEELTKKHSLHKQMVPVYHRYLTLEETQQLINFYKSPIGQKAMMVVPQMVEEGTQVAQQWGLSLVPKIEERVLVRLQEEGIQVSY